MSSKNLFSNFGLIGDNLDLKQNINLEISRDGKIINISYDNIYDNLDLLQKGQNFLLIPGLINSHVHIGDNFAKELGFNKDLIDIVEPPNGLKHKLLAETHEKIKVKGIKNAVLEMLSNGITCFIDFRERGVNGLSILKEALKDSPIYYLALGRFTDGKEIEKVIDSADGIGLANYTMVSKKNKEKLKEFKSKYKKLFACHIAELSRENYILKELINDKIVDIIIHGTHFIIEDLKQIKHNNIKLVLCPRCNGYFGVGFPPINDILRLKIPVSLGTDNLMANSPDLFEEMRYTYLISRIMDKSYQISAKQLLKMVTINAAKIFNLEENLGSISEGKYADFFMIDLNSPNYHSPNIDNNSFFPLILQRTKSNNIKRTYRKGECVFERN
ncbi:hypothetical protein LCGC14_0583070 [marine sediment metagenome]|uniref:Amidohydrolase-related domain-containing protein n=1 Tax=marine sediment metagenome TaxID=412755 RepID=A0A0F9RFU2_9ZZZZ